LLISISLTLETTGASPFGLIEFFNFSSNSLIDVRALFVSA